MYSGRCPAVPLCRAGHFRKSRRRDIIRPNRLESHPMVKDPRPRPPRSPEPDEALDLLRALARSQPPGAPSRAPEPPRGAPAEDEKLDALRALAAKLDLQLRGPNDGVPAPPPAGPPYPSYDMPGAAHDEAAFAAYDIGHPVVAAGTPAPRPPRPRFGLQHKIFIAIAVAVLALAAFGVLRQRAALTPGPPATLPAVPVTPPAQIVPPVEQLPPAPPPAAEIPDLPAINKAMAECDASAAQSPDALNFLVLPLVATAGHEADWQASALQTIGSAYLLLSAKDALDGLRDNRLAVRPGRYTFSVLDGGSGATYSWTSATTMARLAKANLASLKSLKLGFDFSATQSGAQWSAEFKRDVGACYWVMVLVR